MRFEELNWFDIERYLEGEDRLMLIIGACEQHGYLSLLTDVKIPLAIADSASMETGVLVAPVLNFGCSPYFLAYPGTISLRLSTLMDVVEDILRSVFRNGVRRILVLNGHGGNDGVRSRIYELLNEFPEMKLRWYSWWQSHSVESICKKYGIKPAHANWLESFPFAQVTELPEGVKRPPEITGMLGAEAVRQTYGDGVFGGEYFVDRNIMNEIFQAVLQDVIHLLNFEEE